MPTDNAVVVSEGSSVQFVDPYAAEIAEAAIIGNYGLARDVAFSQERSSTNAVFSAERTNERSLKAITGVVEGSFDFADSTIDRVLDSNDRTIEGSFELLSENNLAALKNVETANKSILDVSNEAISKVESATRSDATESFNKLVTMIGLIAAAGVITFGLRK